MTARSHTIDLDPSTYWAAKHMAERERITIEALLESLVRDRAEYVDTFDRVDSFNLGDWEMNRNPEESDEQYEARLALFR
jgi:broad specificity phosphatase PhoE